MIWQVLWWVFAAVWGVFAGVGIHVTVTAALRAYRRRAADKRAHRFAEDHGDQVMALMAAGDVESAAEITVRTIAADKGVAPDHPALTEVRRDITELMTVAREHMVRTGQIREGGAS